jgi:hypothetical protein
LREIIGSCQYRGVGTFLQLHPVKVKYTDIGAERTYSNQRDYCKREYHTNLPAQVSAAWHSFSGVFRHMLNLSL